MSNTLNEAAAKAAAIVADYEEHGLGHKDTDIVVGRTSWRGADVPPPGFTWADFKAIASALAHPVEAVKAVAGDGEPVAWQWRLRERRMKHEDNWSFVDYFTGLKINEYPEKYETRALYAHPVQPIQGDLVKRLGAQATLSDEWDAFELSAPVPPPFLHKDNATLLREAAAALKALTQERDEAKRIATNNADLWDEACSMVDEVRGQLAVSEAALNVRTGAWQDAIEAAAKVADASAAENARLAQYHRNGEELASMDRCNARARNAEAIAIAIRGLSP